MKLKLAVFALFAGLAFIACKKEDKEPTPTTNTGGGGGGGGGSNYPASSATQFSGIFTTGNYVGTTSFTYNINSARAYFSSMPQSYINTATSVMVNKVYLNGDSLPYSVSSNYYMSSATVNLASETWSVNGANGIGTFTISNSNLTTPSASGYLSLPDSISLSAGFTININNVANTTSGGVAVSDGASGFYYMPLNNGNNNAVVSPSVLTSLATTTNASIMLLLKNTKAYVISSKDYQFNREFQFTKALKIKP